ncbi:MAG TPA: hypothetical protein VK661_10150 [Planctomycetota bacterium]|nr:hypothetical protein [Planctomycetota bacterium]
MAVVPDWLPLFFMIGVLLVLVAVPARILWDATRKSRERDDRLGRLAERMREKFGEVTPQRPFLGEPRIRFTVEGRKAVLELSDARRLRLHMEEESSVPLPVVIRSRRWSIWPAGPSLSRISTGDPIVDDAIEILAAPTFAGFLSDRFLDGMAGETSRNDLGDSLIVLKGLPGVKRFEFRFAPDRGVAADLRLSTEDMIHRVDELESLLHHLHQLHERFATYDKWEPKTEASDQEKPSKKDRKV